MATASALAIGLALLILAVIAVSGKAKDTSKAVARANGGPVTVFTGSLAYVVVVAPFIANHGIAASTAILLVVAVLPPLFGQLGARVRDRLPEDAKRTYDAAGVVVAFVLLFGLISAAGSVFSLIGGLNRVVACAAVGLAIAGYLLARGRAGANRTSRWGIGFAVALPVVFVVVGLVTNQTSVIFSPLVPYDRVPFATGIAVIICVLMMGFVDPAISGTLRTSANPGRTALWGAVISALFVALFAIALAMVFGGAFVGPSLQAFLVAATGTAGIAFFMFLVAMVLIPTADTQLAAAADSVEHMAPAASKVVVTFGLAVVAAIVAMLVVANGQVFVSGALIAASAVGALLPAWLGKTSNYPTAPGVVVGVVVAIIVGVIMSVSDLISFSSATVIALILAFVFAAITSALLGRKTAAAVAA